VTRVFRGVTYTIHMVRAGSRSLTVDGTAIEGNVVPLPTGDVTAVSVEATF